MGEAKRKKQRDCPALGGIITPEECGRGRNSSIACPADCPHNPFALVNYESFLDLEGKVAIRLSRMLGDELPLARQREMLKALESGDLFLCHSIHCWHVHWEGGCERWMAEGRFEDWKNDERVMLDHMTSMRPALVEFQQQLDEWSWQAVDLWRPGEPPFAAIDRSSSARACRQEVVLCFLHSHPAGMRFSGTAVSIPAVGDLMPTELMERLLCHLGAPGEDRERWIQEHMALLWEAIQELKRALRARQRYATHRAVLHATYRFPQPALKSLLDLLAVHPRVYLPAEERADGIIEAPLLVEGEEKCCGDHGSIAGMILIAAEHLSFSSFTEEHYASGLALIESLGIPLELHDKGKGDLPEQSAKSLEYDRDLIPGDLLDRIEPFDFRQVIDYSDAKVSLLPPGWLRPEFPDTPHPLLDRTTPREAVGNPALRQRLIAVMKGHLRQCDTLRRTEGKDLDLNPLLEELGLHEIVFAPPPLGLHDRDSDQDHDDGEDLSLDAPPPQPRLSGSELEQRIAMVHSDKELWMRLSVIFAPMLDELIEIEPAFNSDEQDLLFSALVFGVGVMHPHPSPSFDPYLARMSEWYLARLTEGDPDESLDAFLQRLAEETLQPAVAVVALSVILTAFKQRRGKIRTKRREQLCVAVCAAIWEAAHCPVELTDPE
ncbi:hypothetical protein [Luteolibacter sp. Populi]|uniref:hypothetical protein n=1 Tax=Luteolibacter sp. Populi TaxID=3230487 RepID=UPI003467D4AC